MPGGFSQGMALCNGTSVGVNAAANRGTAVTTGAAAYGSYTQLVAATAADTNFMIIDLSADGAVISGYGAGVKIAVGAAGSEIDIIKDLQNYVSASTYIAACYVFPVSIPAGTRIAAAASGNNAAGDTVYVDLQLFDANFLPTTFAGVDSIGANGNGSYGTSVTSGAAFTKGSYTQLVAATPRDYSALGFTIAAAAAATGIPASQRVLLDMTIGAGGSEQIIIPDWFINVNATYNSPLGTIFCLPIEIPAGTRLAMRVSSSSAATVFGIVGYGMYQ